MDGMGDIVFLSRKHIHVGFASFSLACVLRWVCLLILRWKVAALCGKNKQSQSRETFQNMEIDGLGKMADSGFCDQCSSLVA